jgi:protein TonB
MMWVAPTPRHVWLREAGGWLAAATTAALPLSLALMWVDVQSGHDLGRDAVVMLDLAVMPPVAAVTEPPPSPPQSGAPNPAPAPSASETAPARPAAETAPKVPRPAEPVPPIIHMAADNAPDPQIVTDPLPIPVADAVAEVAPRPALRPKARTLPPRDSATTKPRKTRTAADQQAATQDAAPAAEPVAASGSAPGKSTQPAATRKGDASLEAGWGAQIRSRIERRKAYPRAAGGAAGRVTLTITVARDGLLESVALAASSGHAALDQAAVAAVRRAGRLPAAPAGLGAPRHVFTLPMDFAP